METTPRQAWHGMTAGETLRALGTDAASGLSPEEAARRLLEGGPNELPTREARPAWRIAAEQFASVMITLLVVAAAVSALIGEARDAAAILAIVVLNAALGFRQEYRAEKAMDALRRLAVPSVAARRGGRVCETPARELVPGDIVLLAEGDIVPADCRVIECAALGAQESALTGESEAVGKNAEPLLEEAPELGDRKNVLFMGTVVTSGRAVAAVTATGTSTELGGIARLLGSVRRSPTPLQRRLAQLGRTLAAAAVVLVVVIFLVGIARGESSTLMFLAAVSLAVAAVPEGLPAVVTIALALGSQRMLGRRALIRKLAAVETLGTVSVICSDKTGTLTGNRMAVAAVAAGGRRVELAPGAEAAAQADPAVALLLAGGALCSDAALDPSSPSPRASGDPTEAALVEAAARHGLRKDDLERAFPRAAEVPFDAARRRMTTVHDWPAGAALPGLPPPASAAPSAPARVVFTKGAVDGLLDLCVGLHGDGGAVVTDPGWKERVQDASDRMAADGMRVLGVAYRLAPRVAEGGADAASLERDLVFVGMAGMVDPARPGVPEAVATCRAAGIRPVMITGDHPLTALHVARSLGIGGDGTLVTGRDLAAMPDDELAARVGEVSVFARVAPAQKLRIVEALQARGQVVAMTGDGVNDAPALKRADIGVAMGAAGTDVAKEAADMILLDDSFATIVAAVEEGRVIYANIRKFLEYILMSNFGEILVMLLGPLLGMPLPLWPLQILWINLVTDGLPALALAVEPAERGTMRRPPLPPDAHILGGGTGRRILWGGALTGIVSIGAGYAYWRAGLPQWQTALFCTITFAQMGNVLAIRTGREPLRRAGTPSNRPLLGAVALTVALQLLAVYLPFLQPLFRTVPLTAQELLVCAALGALLFLCLDLSKRFRRGGGAAACGTLSGS